MWQFVRDRVATLDGWPDQIGEPMMMDIGSKNPPAQIGPVVGTLQPSQQHQNEKNDDHKAEPAGGIVAPP